MTLSPEAPYKSISRSVGTLNVSIHAPTMCKGYRSVKYKPADLKLQINHYRFQSYEYLIGIKSGRGGGVHKQKYQNAFGWIKAYSKLPVSEDTLLFDLSTELIEQLNADEQNKPRTDLYPDTIWPEIKEMSIEQINEKYL
jgi:hypothetical protein